MTNFYAPMSVCVKRQGDSIPVECEYEPIRIKWDSGYMDIVPPALFDAPLAKIRKIFKLAAESDYMHRTSTVSALRKAIKADASYQSKVLAAITEDYNAGYAEIVDGTGKQDKKRGAKLRALQKRRAAALKRLESRRKKVGKCAEILEEITNEVM